MIDICKYEWKLVSLGYLNFCFYLKFYCYVNEYKIRVKYWYGISRVGYVNFYYFLDSCSN